jgi:hypothetical protein
MTSPQTTWETVDLEDAAAAATEEEVAVERREPDGGEE